MQINKYKNIGVFFEVLNMVEKDFDCIQIKTQESKYYNGIDCLIGPVSGDIPKTMYCGLTGVYPYSATKAVTCVTPSEFEIIVRKFIKKYGIVPDQMKLEDGKVVLNSTEKIGGCCVRTIDFEYPSELVKGARQTIRIEDIMKKNAIKHNIPKKVGNSKVKSLPTIEFRDGTHLSGEVHS